MQESRTGGSWEAGAPQPTEATLGRARESSHRAARSRRRPEPLNQEVTPEAPEAEPSRRAAVTSTSKFPTLNRLANRIHTTLPQMLEGLPLSQVTPRARPSATGAGSKMLAALGQLFGKEYSEPSKDFFPSFEKPQKFQ